MINEIVEKIIELFNVLDERELTSWGAEYLLRAKDKLITLMANLSPMVADATMQANTAYVFRKYKYATDYKALRNQIDKISSKDAEMEALEMSKEEHLREIQKQYEADQLKGLMDVCFLKVNSLSQTISYLKQEKQENDKS